MDTGENPEVPFPRDMIDLEVNNSKEARYVSFYLNAEIIFLCGWRVEEFLLQLSALSLVVSFLWRLTIEHYLEQFHSPPNKRLLPY